MILDQVDDQLIEFNKEFDRLEQLLFEGNEEQLFELILAIGVAAAIFNARQFTRIIKTTTGIDYQLLEPWLEPFLRRWTNYNVSLIKGLPNWYQTRINTIITNAFNTGQTAQALAKELTKITKQLQNSRANLIARDQIGKLNGELTRRRQVDAGINMYIWQTAQDERVRGNPSGRYPKASPSHHAMNGKLCRWDDSTVYSDDGGKTWKKRSSIGGPNSIPGMEIQCRCSATPYLDQLIEEIEQEKDNEKII